MPLAEPCFGYVDASDGKMEKHWLKDKCGGPYRESNSSSAVAILYYLFEGRKPNLRNLYPSMRITLCLLPVFEGMTAAVGSLEKIA